MGKPIPKKKRNEKGTLKAIARKKRQGEIQELISPRAQRKAEREADNELIDLEERATERYEWALALSKLQDEETTVAINRMVMTMARMAGPARFKVHADQARLDKIQYYNHLWITMRLFVACAEWGIRVGNFKAPKKQCVRCGKKVK